MRAGRVGDIGRRLARQCNAYLVGPKYLSVTVLPSTDALQPVSIGRRIRRPIGGKAGNNRR